MLQLVGRFVAIWLCALYLYSGGSGQRACCQAGEAYQGEEHTATHLEIPDIEVRDQEGKSHLLFTDLIEGKVVAVSFIFTTCTTICPPIGANFAKLEKALGDRAGREVQLLSISVDPLTDTPARLKSWKARFDGGPGWTLVTGAKTEIDKALKAMQFYTADKTDHSPFLLLGNQKTGNWRRVNGFTEPGKLVGLLDELAGSRDSRAITATTLPPRQETPSTGDRDAEGLPAAQRYFTDVELVDQHGKKHRLYSDLMKDKIVVMQSFFASCKGVCPKTVGAFAKIQDHLGDKLGNEIHMLSITVDPANDTVPRLRDYAAEWKAKPGWYFLTGEAENLRTALHKFGHLVEVRESHSNVFIMGNVATGLWKKAMGLADEEGLFEVLDSVIEDGAGEDTNRGRNPS